MRTVLFYAAFLFATWPATARDDIALINAASFALTGSDRGIQVIDLGACTFRQRNDTFYLNNVQSERITFQKENLIQADGTSRIYIHLHGSIKVVEHQAEPKNEAAFDYIVSFYTNEYDRVVRAWNYIYANGCTGKRSAF